MVIPIHITLLRVMTFSGSWPWQHMSKWMRRGNYEELIIQCMTSFFYIRTLQIRASRVLLDIFYILLWFVNCYYITSIPIHKIVKLCNDSRLRGKQKNQLSLQRKEVNNKLWNIWEALIDSSIDLTFLPLLDRIYLIIFLCFFL